MRMPILICHSHHTQPSIEIDMDAPPRSGGIYHISGLNIPCPLHGTAKWLCGPLFTLSHNDRT